MQDEIGLHHGADKTNQVCFSKSFMVFNIDAYSYHLLNEIKNLELKTFYGVLYSSFIINAISH